MTTGNEIIFTDGTHVVNVHPIEKCAGQVCVVHNPSAHHMLTWKASWDNAFGLVTRECEHEYQHPDPDSLAWMVLAYVPEWVHAARVHDCDMCCHPPKSREVTS